MRTSGILMPVASLPSKYGIGCFSKEAYEFVDRLHEAGQKYWQLLPLGPTGYGDSPYQSFSTFAGNPYFIDLEVFISEGMLTVEDCESENFGNDSRKVDYGKIYHARSRVLWKAFQNSGVSTNEKFQLFCEENGEWLLDYALFMAVKAHFGDRGWSEWEDDIKMRQPEALEKYRQMLAEEIIYHKFVQYQFLNQWKKLKHYANEKGIKIIGDIPIYVALDSADSWAHPELFQMDAAKRLTAQAGCPPDGFSATGQLWGNPLYDWAYHQQTGYEWWTRRIAHHRKLFDVIRIDHFRGLDKYYSIPFENKTAEHGTWMPGPGMEIFEVIKRKLGTLDIIAEDLGFLTESVFKLLADTGYPGMKVLQFAFDSREAGDYLPHNYSTNCIVYTGTHDNNTVKGWFQSMKEDDRDYALEYLGRDHLREDEISQVFIRMAQSSVAKLCVIPIQDYLDLDGSARINTPATLGENWIWRMLPHEFTKELADKIRQITRLYGRL